MDVWEKMERHSAEDRLMRQEKNLSLRDLAEKSDRMAMNIVATPELIKEVSANLNTLVLGTEAEQENLGKQIAARHSEAIPAIVEDKREQAALIVAVARRIENLRPSVH